MRWTSLRTARRRRLFGVVAALSLAGPLVLASVPASAAMPAAKVTPKPSAKPTTKATKPKTPTQAEVDAAKKKVADKAAAIAAIQAKLQAANDKLDELNTQAEVAFEEYNGAMVELQNAQAVADAANAKVASAKQDVKDTRSQMDRFAAASYRGGGELGSLSVLLESDSPTAFINRASILTMVSRTQGDFLGHLHAVEAAESEAELEASQALAAQQAQTDKVAAAKAAAEAAVASQQRQIAANLQTQRDLEAQLAVANGKVADIVKARADGLAREKAEREAAERAARERAARNANLPSGSGLPVPGVGKSLSTSDGAARAVAFAQSQIGTWYKWSGEGETDWAETPNGRIQSTVWDCSGLTMMAWRAGGVSLSHYSQAQWGQGLRVSKDDLRPGDLVFFAYDTSKPSTIHHVGLYIGDGQMIDAPATGKQTGIHSIGRPDYIGAVRP